MEARIISKVERDLKAYPDWIVRLEVGGLGIPSRALVVPNGGINYGSLVERDAELSDDIKRKVMAIEKVYDRLHGKMKELVDLRYFRGYTRGEIIDMLNISKRNYYSTRDRAIECFARSFGYIN